MTFVLKYAVIHSFEKEHKKLGLDRNKVVLKPLFDVRKKGIQALVAALHDLLGKPGNNVVWGQFSDNRREGDFPTETRSIITSDTADQFENLTRVGMRELVEHAANEMFSTGGFILFAHYVSNQIPFLLVTNIKQRDGLRLDANYEPVEGVDIDMSKVQQAARVNLSRLSEILNPEVAEPQSDVELTKAELERIALEKEKTYLCFISKGKNSEASGYFIEALGCQKGVPSARATKNAYDAVKDFFSTKPSLAPYKKQARESVIAYLESKIGNGHATLAGVYAAAARVIPSNNADYSADLEELTTFLNDEDRQVPEEFVVNSAALKQRIRIKGVESQDQWSVNFNTGALGIDQNSKVCYRKEDRKIILSDPSEALVKVIEKALREIDAG